ncbi:hypothetical protein BCR32DRAFT_147197 [Anaeromyces robustus]|uniref:TRP C-terminal domain-containing protein n=1 Tax=Anaeromyces robustus TaxID=1754192 RepID=A0A1Y1XPD3_9FUNG|nr:hypothetical protein BCR32DRAFT_147197 [Anaeromyces robustus]|eukprot:ORX87597.1 hypothetical protein BCR32DRAFT_147197 [Anaeromyces robustus]
MFTVSFKTIINPVIHCILLFIQDFQFLYFICFDENVISLNKKIRFIINMMGLDLDFSIFRLVSFTLNFIFLACIAIMIIHIAFINPTKYTENTIIKISRIIIILYNTAVFPIFTHSIFKGLIPKNGKLASFTEIDFLGSQHRPLFFISAITLIFYLVFQIVIFPFVYVSPTAFNKKNSLCQKFSYFNIKYNSLFCILSLLFHVFNAYFQKGSEIIVLILSIFMIISVKDIFIIQPYYNVIINQFKGGMMTMTIGMAIVNLFAYLFGKGKFIFNILLIVVGIIFFVGGVLSCRIIYMKNTKEIYRRFKEKINIDNEIYNYQHNIQNSESGSSDSKSTSSVSDENQNEIKEDQSNSNSNNSEDNNEEEDNEMNEEDDVSNVELNDRLSERISSFNEIDNINNR